MSHYLKNILRNSSTRILVIIFGFLIFLTAYFIISGYYTQLKIYEEKELTKLKSIASTLALQVDGEAHKILMEKYPDRDAIKDNDQDPIYKEIHNILKEAKIANGLETTIYTMCYDSEEKDVCFGVSTSENPFFRHEYEDYPEDLINKYKYGGVIPPYKDENGTWLSAFYPFTDIHGNVAGVIQVDEKFDSFITAANKAILKTSAISVGIMILVAFFFLKSIRGILRKEDEMTRRILESKAIIEQKNKDITDSIHYAWKIQQAILPPVDRISEMLPESFVLYKPRDIVSGDFYWFAECENKILIAAVDCTGHGVPGAFMSMIGNTLLNEIVNKNKIVEPAEILNKLDAGIQHALKQNHKKAESRDGMDLALCSFDKSLKKVSYAGALRPLVHISREGKLVEIKGDRFPIGGGMNYDKSKFTNHVVELEEGDRFYIFSDGFPDQFGGDKGKKFMTKRFKDILVKNYKKDMKAQGIILEKRLEDWRGRYEQVDDVLVIGIQIPELTPEQKFASVEKELNANQA